MKKATILIILVCAVLIAAVFISCQTLSVDSLLKNQNTCAVSFYLIDLEQQTPDGACPQIQTGQQEMEEMQDFLQTTNVKRWRFNPDASWIDTPGYYLYFFGINPTKEVEMYISRTGYIRCGNWVYRITEPSSDDVWERLCGLYESAVSLQN